jgi:DNA-directed RNA polymerase subunit RPC12/RpoP
MIFCIDSHELIICPECAAKVIYADDDVQVLTSTSCEVYSFENKIQQAKVIRCPKCYKTIIIENIKPFIIGVDLAKEKDMGVNW